MPAHEYGDAELEDLRRRTLLRSAVGLALGISVFGGAAQAAAAPIRRDDEHVRGRSGGTEDLGQMVADIQQLIAKSWPVGEKVWPGTKMAEQYLILVSERQAWELTVNGVTPLDRAEVDALAPEYSWMYFFTSWKDSRATVIDLEQTKGDDWEAEHVPLPVPGPESNFDLGTHEFFHDFQTQQGWRPPREEEVLRYPLEPEWPLYRALVYDALRKALTDHERREEHLAAAAYWHRKWDDRFGADNWLRTPDVHEGTAQFFSTQMLAAARATNPSNDDERWARSLSLTYDWSPKVHPAFLWSKNSSYILGAVAGTLLEMGGGSWREGATTKDTLTDLLLTGCPAIDVGACWPGSSAGG
ncbi:hypothetical protein ACIQU6_44095 [Streptomyces sp. NPDC090442]|uniref:hypothetical protein n=1 Tax=Streptomyces sp. NPDC090442 TaxID=3365962 RepID=UPI0037F3F55D